MSLPQLWQAFGPDYLPYRLLQVSRLIDRKSARDVQNYGLTLAEWRVLAYMNWMGPTTASEIGKLGQIDRAEISRAVGKLENKGLIERKPDPAHRKRFIIVPTDAGGKLFSKIRQARLHSFRTMIAPLSQQEREVMEKALEVIALQLSDT